MLKKKKISIRLKAENNSQVMFHSAMEKFQREIKYYNI